MPARSPYLELGPSADTLGVLLLLLACAALAAALLRHLPPFARLSALPSPKLLAALAVAACGLSALYVGEFLRGGPRIVDATSYFLEARALADGKLAFEVPAPSAAFRGRFLLAGPSGLAVIFPPGYPAVLALGFLAGSPLAVGPVLAALLVLATYVLVRELLGREDVARVAAVLSVFCAALRYHTADTMSHGLSALLLASTFAALARPTPLRCVVGGLAAGFLCATRPVSGGVACVLGMLLLAARTPRRALPWRAPAYLAALLPGVALLLLHQRAATGSWFGSTQLAYYALADGPPGCFAWGFGENVGCRFEHGDFVRASLPDGFGLVEALRVTAHRLAVHTVDVANLAPLALLVPWAAYRHRHDGGVRWLAAGAAAVILAYLPFYFPGSYPGGGARFFADALPLEHGLLALALVKLRVQAYAPFAALAGFALHAVHAHRALADREGGRPMFEPSVLERAGVSRGLVFVTTDHGFSLGHDPSVRSASEGVIIARASHDAHDLALWRELGRPSSFLYRYSVETGRATVEPYTPDASRFRLEAEAEWPPLGVGAGWVHPDFRPCLSRGRGLHLRASPTASVELEIVTPGTGEYELAIGWLADPGVEMSVFLAGDSARLQHGTRGCEHSNAGSFRLGPLNRVRLIVGHSVLVDYLDLARVDSKKR